MNMFAGCPSTPLTDSPEAINLNPACCESDSERQVVGV